jgi:hypothetical protein
MMDGEKSHTDGFDKAMLALFRPPALQFSRSLRAELDKDPDFLRRHEKEVYPVLERYLRVAGVLLEEHNTEDQMQHVIREVVIRLRSYEKGSA